MGTAYHTLTLKGRARKTGLKKCAGEVESIRKPKIPVMIAVDNYFAGCAQETVKAFQKMLKLI